MCVCSSTNFHTFHSALVKLYPICSRVQAEKSERERGRFATISRAANGVLATARCSGRRPHIALVLLSVSLTQRWSYSTLVSTQRRPHTASATYSLVPTQPATHTVPLPESLPKSRARLPEAKSMVFARSMRISKSNLKSSESLSLPFATAPGCKLAVFNHSAFASCSRACVRACERLFFVCVFRRLHPVCHRTA